SVELLAEPEGDGALEREEAARGVGEVSLQDAVELLEGLVVEDDVLEIGGPDAGLLKAISDGLARKGVIVANAGEALFLCGGHDLAVADERRRAVVIECRNSEDVPGRGHVALRDRAGSAGSAARYKLRRPPPRGIALGRGGGPIGASARVLRSRGWRSSAH